MRRNPPPLQLPFSAFMEFTNWGDRQNAHYADRGKGCPVAGADAEVPKVTGQARTWAGGQEATFNDQFPYPLHKKVKSKKEQVAAIHPIHQSKEEHWR